MITLLHIRLHYSSGRLPSTHVTSDKGTLSLCLHLPFHYSSRYGSIIHFVHSTSPCSIRVAISLRYCFSWPAISTHMQSLHTQLYDHELYYFSISYLSPISFIFISNKLKRQLPNSIICILSIVPSLRHLLETSNRKPIECRY